MCVNVVVANRYPATCRAGKTLQTLLSDCSNLQTAANITAVDMTALDLQSIARLDPLVSQLLADRHDLIRA